MPETSLTAAECLAVRVVVDWDGTVTVQDLLVQVIERFGIAALLRELEPRVGVDLTLHEEIALEFAAVTAPLDEVVDGVLEHVEVRPGLRELAELHAPVVISARFPRSRSSRSLSGGRRAPGARERPRRTAGRVARALPRRSGL